MSGEARLLPMVQRLFGHQQEDVKTAASICMGNATIGNPSFFLNKVFRFRKSSNGCHLICLIAKLEHIDD